MDGVEGRWIWWSCDLPVDFEFEVSSAKSADPMLSERVWWGNECDDRRRMMGCEVVGIEEDEGRKEGGRKEKER
jgi:hypothetical protein